MELGFDPSFEATALGFSNTEKGQLKAYTPHIRKAPDVCIARRRSTNRSPHIMQLEFLEITNSDNKLLYRI